MSRPLPYVLAAALAVSFPALSAAPVAAQSQSGMQLVGHGGDWDNTWRTNWDNDNRRWGNRRHGRHDNFRPGFSFSFGVPFPPVYTYYPRPSRDCYREWDGSLYCRTY